MSDDEIRTRLKDSALKWIEFFLNDAGLTTRSYLCHKTLFLTSITCAVIILLQHRPFQSLGMYLKTWMWMINSWKRLEEYNVESVLDEIAESYASQYSGLEILNISKRLWTKISNC